MPAFPRHVLCTHTGSSVSCSTLVDLTPGRNGVLLKLACLTAFTVTVEPDSVDALVDALRTADVCAVVARHAQRGGVLLGVRPHVTPGQSAESADEVPMELELHLASTRHIRLVFTRAQTAELVAHLADGRTVLAAYGERC